ncbi:MAG: ABC transporter substrate-binding protein [Actinomycetota bacterium]
MNYQSRGARLLALLLALVLVAAACGSDDSGSDEASGSEASSASASETASEESGSEDTGDEAAASGPVTVCELAYYTGDFADFGEQLTGNLEFPITNVINADPPLGREWQLVSEDLGTVGEGQAARACLERHEAEVVVSIAHGYREYRDFMIEYWAENDSPIVPSVHGGAIPGNLGGSADEPIFRAQGLDAGLGTAGALYAESIGAENVVIFQTEVEGFTLASDAAEGAAEAVGIDVLARIRTQASQPSYRAQVEEIADLEPDAVIVQAGTIDSGTLIKQAAEAGLSLTWIGETGWTSPEFMDTLGADLVSTQESIGFAAFGPNTTTDAWSFYEPAVVGAFGEDVEDSDTPWATPGDLYMFSTYDVMVHTALAVEHAGSYSATDWSASMREVGSAPGTQCFTYESCLELIRAGEDIDYEGVTGSADYTDGGVNNMAAAYTPFNDDGTQGDAEFLDAGRSNELVDAVAPVAECEDNVCDW